jgi:hypothetical protein
MSRHKPNDYDGYVGGAMTMKRMLLVWLMTLCAAFILFNGR